MDHDKMPIRKIPSFQILAVNCTQMKYTSKIQKNYLRNSRLEIEGFLIVTQDENHPTRNYKLKYNEKKRNDYVTMAKKR